MNHHHHRGVISSEVMQTLTEKPRRASADSHETKQMASFDPDEKENVPCTGGSNANFEVTKYPLKRLELSIRKFVKVLDIDLDRLFKHTANIARLTNAEDWNGLHKEQINASRTIQQIKANIKEIERVRNQVKDEDLHQFDTRVQEVKLKAMAAMEEFMNFVGVQHNSTLEGISTECGTGDISGAPHASLSDTQAGSRPKLISIHSQNASAQQQIFDEGDSDAQSPTPYGSLPAVLTSATMPAPVLTTSLHVVPQNSQASASWEQLQENIVELNEMVHQFAENVEQQGEVVDRIDDNIETAHENIKEGTSKLAKAAKYKAALLPVACAAVGGVVGGPIGLVAGMKLGGFLGAVGAGAVGYAGGSMWKERQNKINQVEMSNLSDQRSVSLPDLPQSEKKEKTPDAPEENERKASQSSTEGEKPKEETEEDKDVFSTVTTSFKRFFSFSGE